MVITRGQIKAQKKELDKKQKALAQVEQSGYDTRVKEMKDALRAQVKGVCRGYCLQVWTEALNLVGVEASSDLRKKENIFYPPALRIATSQASQATTAPKVPPTIQPTDKALTIASSTAKASTATQPANMGTTKATSDPAQASKEKEASQGKEVTSKTTSRPPKAPKEKVVSQGKEVEHSNPPTTIKADPSPSKGN